MCVLVGKVLVVSLSTATTAVATQVLGKRLLECLGSHTAIIDQYWGSAACAEMVFASFRMMFAVLVTKAGGNSLPVGADLADILQR